MTSHGSDTLPRLEKYVYDGLEKGPVFVVTGRIHGNEPAGELACRRLIDQLERGEIALKAGRLIIFPLINPVGKDAGVRGVAIDMNRDIHADFYSTQTPEHALRTALVQELQQIAQTTVVIGQGWFLLDIHSVPMDGKGHLVVSDLAKDFNLASSLGPDKIYTNWMQAVCAVSRDDLEAIGRSRAEQERYSLALIYGANAMGADSAICLEAGQHDDPASVDRAYQGILNALSGLDLVDGHLSSLPPEKIVLREFQTMIVRRDKTENWVGIDHDGQDVEPGQLIFQGEDRAVYVPHKEGRWVIAHPNLNAQIGQHAGYLARERDCFQDHPDIDGPS